METIHGLNLTHAFHCSLGTIWWPRGNSWVAYGKTMLEKNWTPNFTEKQLTLNEVDIRWRS